MIKKYLRLFFFLVFISLFLPSYSQWQMAEGLDGGKITSMISIDSVLIGVCGKGGGYSGIKGVFAKSDNGIWEMSYDNHGYVILEKAGKCAFASSSRSFDNGQTWEFVPNLIVTATVDTVIFHYSYNEDKFRRSFDYGDNFEDVDMPGQYHFNRFFSGDSLLCLNSIVDNHNQKLFYSSDFGTSWDSIPTTGLFEDHPYYDVMQFKYLNDAFWIQLESDEVPWAVRKLFVFDDQMNKWIDVTNNLPTRYWHHHLFAHNGGIYCSIDTYPVFKFNFSDSSWIEFANASKNVNRFLEHNGQLFCATDQGAFSLDANGNWTSYNEGLHQRDITSIETLDEKIYVAASNELFRSDDGGLSFQKMDNAWGSQIIATDSVFYMIAPHEYKMSWDEGESWQEFSDSLHIGRYQRFNQLDINPEYFYLASYQGLFRSVTDSISWELIPSMDFNTSLVKTIDSTVFVKGFSYPNFYLYYSTDYGETFIEHSDLCDFTKLDQIYYLFRDSILYSNDLGQSWKSFPFIEDKKAFCIARQGDSIIMGGGIYFGFSNPIIQLSEDLGENWIDIYDNLPVHEYMYDPIRQVKKIGNRLFAGIPQSGLWYRDDLLTNISVKPAMSNDQFVKVYPNPAQDRCFFEYTLDSPSKVIIRIFDRFGKQVDLIEDTKASGKHIVLWDIGNVPSGIYLFKFNHAGYGESGKFLVIE